MTTLKSLMGTPHPHRLTPLLVKAANRLTLPTFYCLFVCRWIVESVRTKLSHTPPPASSAQKQHALPDATYGEQQRFALQHSQAMQRIHVAKHASIDFKSLGPVSVDHILKLLQPTHDELKDAFVRRYFLPLRYWLCKDDYNQLTESITRCLRSNEILNEALGDVLSPVQREIAEKTLGSVGIRVQIRKIVHACINDKPNSYQDSPLLQGLQTLSLLPSEQALQAEKIYFQYQNETASHQYVHHELLKLLFLPMLASRIYTEDNVTTRKDMQWDEHIVDKINYFQKQCHTAHFWESQQASWRQRETTSWLLYPGFYTQFGLYEHAAACLDHHTKRIHDTIQTHWNDYLLPTFLNLANIIATVGKKMQKDRMYILPEVPLRKRQLFKLCPEKAANTIQTHWRQHQSQRTTMPCMHTAKSKTV